jgi:hypothetical protein
MNCQEGETCVVKKPLTAEEELNISKGCLKSGREKLSHYSGLNKDGLIGCSSFLIIDFEL